MTISMFQVAVPPSIQALVALGGVLAKGEAHAIEHHMDPADLLGARLAPDMLPLTRQVQIASDTVKNGCGRLAGVDIPSFPDTETSFPELQDRIERTLAFLAGLHGDQIDGSEDRVITMKLRGAEKSFAGRAYLLGFVLPNLYFHTATAYAILRHRGVAVGKSDFLGAPPG